MEKCLGDKLNHSAAAACILTHALCSFNSAESSAPGHGWMESRPDQHACVLCAECNVITLFSFGTRTPNSVQNAAFLPAIYLKF